MIKLFIAIFTTSILLSGCSRYVLYLQNSNSTKLELKKEEGKNQYCKSVDNLNIYHNSDYSISEFKKILAKTKGLNFREKVILYIIYQIQVRNDATDWVSRTQLHFKFNDTMVSQDFQSGDFPLISALMKISNRKELKKLIKRSNYLFPKKLKVQQNLNFYLENNKSIFKSNKRLKEKFFRIEKPLQKGESFTRDNLSLPKLLNITNPKGYIFPLKTQDREVGFCNFDSALYDNGIFLIDGIDYQENIFGLFDQESYFLMVTKKQIKNDLKQSKKSHYFQGVPSNSLSPFCVYSNNNNKLITVGFNSRDPGQVLYQLFNYKIYDAKTPAELAQYLNFPRHQFLTKPSRLLFESKKGTAKQLDYFLSFNFPVYHIENLGGVNAILERDGKVNFIDDNRVESVQSCQLK